MQHTTRLTLECSSFRVTALPQGRVVIDLEDVASAPVTGETIYDKDGVARRLMVSIRTIDNYMRRRKNPLPYSKHAGNVRFLEKDVQAWLETGKARR